MAEIIDIDDALYLIKGGPGSGRYPAGSGGGKKSPGGGGGFSKLTKTELKEMSKYTDILNEDTKYALGTYAGGLASDEDFDENNSEIINTTLRSKLGVKGLDKVEQQQVAMMDRAIAYSTIPADTTLYRGASDFELKEGDVFSDKAFCSTSTSMQTAEDFSELFGGNQENPLADGSIYKIQAPKGAQGLYLEGLTGNGEGEILLPRNSQFVVLGVDNTMPKVVYTLGLIPRSKGEMP